MSKAKSIKNHYLLMYKKKGKQRFLIFNKDEMFDWISENPTIQRKIFWLEPASFHMRDE